MLPVPIQDRHSIMASRKEQKEQLRARRLTQLAAVAAAAMAIVAVAVILGSSGGGGSTHDIQSGARASKTVAAVTTLLRGIPQSGNTLGAAGAPVKMTYFGDLECPICKDFSLTGLTRAIGKLVRPGKLQVEYRSLKSATGPTTTFVNQQAAALAAGRQRRMWHYVELFYRQQGAEGSGYVTDAYLQQLARQVPGFDVAAWERERRQTALVDLLKADAGAAHQAGAMGTPTLVIQGPSGSRTLSGNVSYGAIASAVAAVS
jgi:protein-disulfide isomerase